MVQVGLNILVKLVDNGVINFFSLKFWNLIFFVYICI